MNDDGLVDKVWLFLFVEIEKRLEVISVFEYKVVGIIFYGFLFVGFFEFVCLQFGNFGLSVWQNDKGIFSEVGSLVYNFYVGESVLRNGDLFCLVLVGFFGCKEVSILVLFLRVC